MNISKLIQLAYNQTEIVNNTISLIGEELDGAAQAAISVKDLANIIAISEQLTTALERAYEVTVSEVPVTVSVESETNATITSEHETISDCQCDVEDETCKDTIEDFGIYHHIKIEVDMQISRGYKYLAEKGTNEFYEIIKTTEEDVVCYMLCDVHDGKLVRDYEYEVHLPLNKVVDSDSYNFLPCDTCKSVLKLSRRLSELSKTVDVHDKKAPLSDISEKPVSVAPKKSVTSSVSVLQGSELYEADIVGGKIKVLDASIGKYIDVDVEEEVSNLLGLSE